MQRKKARQGASEPDDLLAEAEAQVLRCGRRLAALIERLEAGELAAAHEVPSAIAALDKALAAVFSERAKRERTTGQGSDTGIDFDAARDEVRRRLDRLRATYAARGVSGEPE